MSDNPKTPDGARTDDDHDPSATEGAANDAGHEEAVSMLDHALRLAQDGIPIFPCKLNKQPYVAGGFKAATTDPNQVRAWWSKWPDALIGMPTGAASGIAVLDLDLRQDEDGNVTTDGLSLIQRVMDENGWKMPETVAVETPNGGFHGYFRHQSGFSNSAGKIGNGIDTRGDGGYVIVPPSRLPDGRCYRNVSEPGLTPADAPEWLAIGFCEHRFPEAEQPNEGASDGDQSPMEGHHSQEGQNSPYGMAALESECAAVAAAPQGTRNDLLNKAAFRMGQLVLRKYVLRAVVEGRLMGAALHAGLGEEEARRSIRSGLDAGMKKPRPGTDGTDANAKGPDRPPGIIAAPYSWRPGADIERRAWIYAPHLIRKYVSVTVAPGGVGKSSLVIADAIAMIFGKTLLRSEPTSCLNVWLFNGEDPKDELERRIAATLQHYGLQRDDCQGQLYVNSGRDTPLIVAKQERDGTKIFEPVVDALVAELVEKKIDVLIVDPFVSCHGVPENDNNAIDQVAKSWARVGELANCAIELVHHSRKANGNEVGVDDARGASALVAAARSVRTLNRLSPDLAKERGLDEKRTYFAVNYGKANLAPSTARRDWYTLESVDIGNGPTLRSKSKEVKLPGDDVGVVIVFEMPDQHVELDPATIRRIQDAVDGKNFRKDPQAEDWVGHAIARVLAMDAVKDKVRLKGIIKDLIASEHFRVENVLDKNRKPRPCIVVGNRAEEKPTDENLRHPDEVERSEVEQ